MPGSCGSSASSSLCSADSASLRSWAKSRRSTDPASVRLKACAIAQAFLLNMITFALVIRVTPIRCDDSQGCDPVVTASYIGQRPGGVRRQLASQGHILGNDGACRDHPGSSAPHSACRLICMLRGGSIPRVD